MQFCDVIVASENGTELKVDCEKCREGHALITISTTVDDVTTTQKVCQVGELQHCLTYERESNSSALQRCTACREDYEVFEHKCRLKYCDWTDTTSPLVHQLHKCRKCLANFIFSTDKASCIPSDGEKPAGCQVWDYPSDYLPADKDGYCSKCDSDKYLSYECGTDCAEDKPKYYKCRANGEFCDVPENSKYFG
jgi:hypothetical protein